MATAEAAVETKSSWRYGDQPKQDVAQCCVCGNDQPRLISAVDRYRFPARFVLCTKCGVVWNTPAFTAEAYAEFYSSGAYRAISEEYGSKHGANEDTRRHTKAKYRQSVRKAFGKHLKGVGGASLLDVGGSDGLVADDLKRFANLGDVAVLEPSANEAAEVPEGIDVHQGTLETVDVGRQYDIVSCLQTIEHFLNPRDALVKMRALCTKMLLIDCIDFPILWKHLRLEVCKIDHPWNFHYEALRCLLSQTGFRPVDMVSRTDKPARFIVAVVDEPKHRVPGPAFVAEVLRMFQ